MTASVDVTDAAALGDFADEWQRDWDLPDLWINNAGVLEPIVAQRHLSADQLADHLAVNVGGVLNGTQAYLHLLDGPTDRGPWSTSARAWPWPGGPAGPPIAPARRPSTACPRSSPSRSRPGCPWCCRWPPGWSTRPCRR